MSDTPKQTPSSGGPAFPHLIGEEGCGSFVSRQRGDLIVYDEYASGMSVRVYLCAHAPECPPGFPDQEEIESGRYRQWTYGERLARWRMHYADAQIALLEGREP